MTAAIYTADELETLFHECLKRGDAKGVEAALTLMASTDPRRAQRLYDALETAVGIARSATDAERPALIEETACAGK